MIKKAVHYGIDTLMMERLNYVDFLALIVELDIDTLKEQLRQKQNSQRSNRGYNIIRATNEDILKMHGM